ncbi:MAG: hypothetical protein HWN68_17940 [Desulfobacterales bacterium]|nr:hypothetical protein [Desulfobacterales bacterium]
MFPIIDAAVSLGGLIIPPLFDFVKKKFVKSENDTPERTMGTLATTKPEVLGDYVKGYADMQRAAVEFFNRDVIGVPSQFIVNIRAAIRPIGVICSFILLGGMAYLILTEGMPQLSPEAAECLTGIRVSAEAMLSSWFGHRIAISK